MRTVLDGPCVELERNIRGGAPKLCVDLAKNPDDLLDVFATALVSDVEVVRGIRRSVSPAGDATDDDEIDAGVGEPSEERERIELIRLGRHAGSRAPSAPTQPDG